MAGRRAERNPLTGDLTYYSDGEFSDDDDPFQDQPPPLEPTRWRARGKDKGKREERASREKELQKLKSELKHAEDMLMLRVPPEQLDSLLLSEIRPLYEDRKNKVAEWFRERVGEQQEQEFLNGEGDLDNVIQMHIREIRLINAKKQLKELKRELKDAEELLMLRTQPMPPNLSIEQLNQNYQDKREKVADWYEKWTTPYRNGPLKSARWLGSEGNPSNIRPSSNHLLPTNWTEKYDPNSRQPIFYNFLTEESRSELPGVGAASNFVAVRTNVWMNHLGVPNGWGYDERDY
jgi:hypothetical protein